MPCFAWNHTAPYFCLWRDKVIFCLKPDKAMLCLSPDKAIFLPEAGL